MNRQENHEKMAKVVCGDNPGTDLERWRSCCYGQLIVKMMEAGRDITIIVGERRLVSRGQYNVITEGERQ